MRSTSGSSRAVLVNIPDRAAPCGQHPDRAAQCGQHPDRAAQCGQHLDRAAQCGQHPDRAAPCCQHLDRAAQCGQHPDRAAPCCQHPDRAAQCGQHPDRAAPCCQHPDRAAQRSTSRPRRTTPPPPSTRNAPRNETSLCHPDCRGGTDGLAARLASSSRAVPSIGRARRTISPPRPHSSAAHRYLIVSEHVFLPLTGRPWTYFPTSSPGTAVHPACGRCSERQEALSISRRGHRWAYVKCARCIKKPLFGRPENGLVNVKILLAVRQDKFHKIHALGILKKCLKFRIIPKRVSFNKSSVTKIMLIFSYPRKVSKGNRICWDRSDLPLIFAQSGLPSNSRSQPNRRGFPNFLLGTTCSPNLYSRGVSRP